MCFFLGEVRPQVKKQMMKSFNNRCGVYTCLYKITMPSSADITGIMGIVRAITPKCLYDDSHDRMNKSFLSSHIYIYIHIHIYIYSHMCMCMHVRYYIYIQFADDPTLF